jgi:hypothetical protein
MWLIPLAVTFLFLGLGTTLCRAKVCSSYPESFIITLSLGFVFVQLTSDALSLFSAFSTVGIAISWLFLLAVLGLSLWLSRSHFKFPVVVLSIWDKAAYLLVGFLVLLTGLTGLLVAPNNWDSLSYHLPRAAHWLQQQSLEFFPTDNARENVMTPLPNLLQAHFMSMSGGDQLLFMGQWLAGIAVLIAVGIATTMVTKDRRAISFSVAVAATVPMFLAQMSTTQSDLIAGLPLAVGVVALRWLFVGRERGAIILAALAGAVAVSIKPTALVLLLPVALVLVITLISRHRWLILSQLIGLTLILTLVVNGYYIKRMLGADSSVPSSASAVFNADFGLQVLGVNALRSLALLISLPVATFNGWLESITRNIASFLGWDADLPSATFNGSFELPQVWSEDHAGAPFHVALLTICLVIAVTSRSRSDYKKVFILTGLLLFQFLALAAFFRWQVWGNRFFFLVIVFSAPVMGAVLVRANRLMRASILIAFGLMAIFWVALQPLRGLAGTDWIPTAIREKAGIPSYSSPLGTDRYDQLFAYSPASAESYFQAFTYALSLKPTTIELVGSGDSWEYPFWVLNSDLRGPKLVHNSSEPDKPQVSLQPIEIVRICIVTCPLEGLTKTKSFVPAYEPNAPVSQGPTITIGTVRIGESTEITQS